MKKILKQYLKQVILILILMAAISILNTAFVKSSIRGAYDTVSAGITQGADAREVEKYLKDSFKEELDFKKKLEVEAVGSFGTEFRIKSNSITDDERDFMTIMLNKKYEEASLSTVTNNPEANYRVDYVMYLVYLVIILIIGALATYFLYLIPVDDEVNIKNIKKTREELIKEENFKLEKEERKRIKEQKKQEKQKRKEKRKKEKKQKQNKEVKVKDKKVKKTKENKEKKKEKKTEKKIKKDKKIKK